MLGERLGRLRGWALKLVIFNDVRVGMIGAGVCTIILYTKTWSLDGALEKIGSLPIMGIGCLKTEIVPALLMSIYELPCNVALRISHCGDNKLSIKSYSFPPSRAKANMYVVSSYAESHKVLRPSFNDPTHPTISIIQTLPSQLSPHKYFLGLFAFFLL